MRKELAVFISSGEAGEEIKVMSIAKNRNLVMFSSDIGKFTASRSELIEALKAIEKFDTENNGNVVEGTIVTLVVDNIGNDIEYGDEV